MSLLIGPPIASEPFAMAAESTHNRNSTVQDSTLYRELLEDISLHCHHLEDKPEETPVAVLRALWFMAAGEPRSCKLALQGALPRLLPEQVAILQGLIAQRKHAVPLAHLTGRQNFMALELLSTPDALIPRKETEILAQAVIDKAQEMRQCKAQVTILDICTGGGNLALACAWHVPQSAVFASDISPEAISLARRNAQKLDLSHRVQFRCGDLVLPFDTPDFLGKVDLLISNPPYLSSTKAAKMDQEISQFEPGLAFDGGPFGVSILMRMLAEAPRFLHRGSWLGLEVGKGQGSAISRRLSGTSIFDHVETFLDSSGEIRAVLARRG